MAKKVVFKLDIGGLRELMKSGEMQAALDEAGSAVASAAGDGHGRRSGSAHEHYRAFIFRTSFSDVRGIGRISKRHYKRLGDIDILGCDGQFVHRPLCKRA